MKHHLPAHLAPAPAHRAASCCSLLPVQQGATNVPNYNNQCGQCLHVQNLQGTGDAYVTVIDYEAAGGLDLNQNVGMTFQTLYQNGHVSCMWTVVSPSLCSFH
ncbi:hypothetical protein WJX82_004556 [Trebouxia sp. C0006]